MAHRSAAAAGARPLEDDVAALHAHLPAFVKPADVVAALEALVARSETEADVCASALAPFDESAHLEGFLGLPGLEELANRWHYGNYVAVRGKDPEEEGGKVFESMPLYTRLGMHLMFYGALQIELLRTSVIIKLLKELSEREGRIYDSPQSIQSIPSFIKTYSLSLDELLQPDIAKYSNFNDFFHRKLKPGSRPVKDPENTALFCSAADSRLTVYPSVGAAQQFWIKGCHFSIPSLIGEIPRSVRARMFLGGSIAIFRLAPQDYHRFHCPIDGVIGDITEIPGQYYTVNPMAVNESCFDVFTENRRSVMYMTHKQSSAPVAIVAIGAMLVGSIVWTVTKGSVVNRGDELGYFAYGGSTVVVIFPPGVCQFDEDLLENSVRPIETLVKVGESLGKSVLSQAAFDEEAVLAAADKKLDASEDSSSSPFVRLKGVMRKLCCI
ncbi:phosphatidylserine decarboxylase-domain-containing protein [Epithele typhae]|uniref:phosphatidylserine decarboxylase-domain-containing protein n=1 Tax=Epithele typhae TaxID=378194 RepID=UPI002007D2E0|nr:phosphatidylserine decarboxylase-domain-containing protein [Epithele typhae]KAH9925857.1 phosphatidylserine decarboxylase-domain-containing protein [Epithele typhae]